MTSPKFQTDRNGSNSSKQPPPKERDSPSHGRSGQGSESLLAHLRQDRRAKAQAAKLKASGGG